MHLPTLRARRACNEAFDRRLATEPTPREAAASWLAEKTRDGDAGLDPYDAAIFILNAVKHERVWANIAVGLCGEVISRTEMLAGGQRIRARLDDSVRRELGLDTAEPPLMADEPLASRAVSPPLALIDPEPESAAALRRAEAAYDRKQVRP